MGAPPRKYMPRLRFRVSTLLWLVVIVATFFLGRQSNEIGLRLGKMWRSIWPRSLYRVAHQPEGSLLFKSKLPVPRVKVTDVSLAQANPLGANQIQLDPKRDGKGQAQIWLQSDNSDVMHYVVTLEFTIHAGEIDAQQSSILGLPVP
jgi:hypothetical protein